MQNPEPLSEDARAYPSGAVLHLQTFPFTLGRIAFRFSIEDISVEAVGDFTTSHDRGHNPPLSEAGISLSSATGARIGTRVEN